MVSGCTAGPAAAPAAPPVGSARPPATPVRVPIAAADAGTIAPAAAGVTRGPREALSRAQRAQLDADRGRESAVIAVVGGGVDVTHPTLDGVVVGRWVAPGIPPAPSASGTQIAGVVAGRPIDGFTGGLGPLSRLIDVTVPDAAGAGDPEQVAAGLRWARHRGPTVVLISLAIAADVPAVRAAVAELIAAGILVIAPTGDLARIGGVAGAAAPAVYPAAYPGVIGVTAYGRAGGLLATAAPMSADLAAPGEEITAPTPAGGYAVSSGTAVAAAMVAGLLIHCRSAPPVGDGSLQRWTRGSVAADGRRIGIAICPALG